MTFRTRLLLIFTASVVAAVGLAGWLVFANTRGAFARLETQRTDLLVAQFRREFERRKEEVVRSIDAVATSESAVNVAISSDYAPYYGEAGTLASPRGLDLLELVAEDGSIVSSAQWPARFGYREEWLAGSSGWKSRGAFLKKEELPDGTAVALMAVSTVTAGDRKLFVAGGQQLDRRFLESLILPSGMRVLLYLNLSRDFAAANLLSAEGPASRAETLRGLVERVRANPRELAGTVGSGPSSEIFHALPLTGYGDELLGVLLIGSSRRDLLALESFLLRTGMMMASAGILVGIALAWWATARVTRPVQRLAESARAVAAGNLSSTVEMSAGDEIGQLARAFNRMTQELVDQRERLVQAERVAAWRELARRLAHELKNPLFPLQITVENMQRARDSYPDQFDEVFREGSATLLAELANLKQIVARFSDFAKMPAPEMERVEPNALVSNAMKLLEAQFEQAHVAAKADLDPAARAVWADPEQITRALRNLMLNAIDAMPAGGTLTVRTVPQPTGVRLEVADTGQGLTPEECARVFTPYYTTKSHGTGLGLAIVQSVVSDHRGRISVVSEPGRGTTFRIDLPEQPGASTAPTPAR